MSVMPDHIWQQGQPVIVAATGPGKLHLLSYNPGINHKSMVGAVQARPQGNTRFLLSHSYGYGKYAFYWEGAGDAVASFGPVHKVPVGKDWTEATAVELGQPTFDYKNVTNEVKTAGVNQDVTCFVIPELGK